MSKFNFLFWQYVTAMNNRSKTKLVRAEVMITHFTLVDDFLFVDNNQFNQCFLVNKTLQPRIAKSQMELRENLCLMSLLLNSIIQAI